MRSARWVGKVVWFYTPNDPDQPYGPTQPPIHWVLKQLSPSIKLTICLRHSKCVAIRLPLSMCLHGVVPSKHWFNFNFTLTKPQYTKAVLLQWFTIAPTTGGNKAERSPVLLSALCLDVSSLLITLWDIEQHNNGTKASAHHHPGTHNFSSWSSIKKYMSNCHNYPKQRKYDAHFAPILPWNLKERSSTSCTHSRYTNHTFLNA